MSNAALELHSDFAPSSAHQYAYCAASIKLQKQYPDLDDTDAREGVAVHWVGSSVLQSYQTEAGPRLTAGVFIGKTAPNGEMITLEMARYVEMYINDVLRIAMQHGLFMALHIEEKITTPSIHERAWGTPDCFAVDANAHKIIIWDLKYGYGIYEAYQNWQCIQYASGLLSKINALGNPKFENINWDIEIRIVQPRPYHPEGEVRVWHTTAAKILTHILILHKQANDPNPATVTGPHCRYCTARLACKALQQSAMACVDITNDNSPDELKGAPLGTEIAILRAAYDRIKWRLDALEAQALGLLTAGKPVPGWGISIGKGRKNWTAPPDAIIALGDLSGVDLRQPPDVITPAQAISAGMDPKTVDAVSSRKTSFKLTPDDNLAKRVFSNDTAG